MKCVRWHGEDGVSGDEGAATFNEGLGLEWRGWDEEGRFEVGALGGEEDGWVEAESFVDYGVEDGVACRARECGWVGGEFWVYLFSDLTHKIRGRGEESE